MTRRTRSMRMREPDSDSESPLSSPPPGLLQDTNESEGSILAESLELPGDVSEEDSSEESEDYAEPVSTKVNPLKRRTPTQRKGVTKKMLFRKEDIINGAERLMNTPLLAEIESFMVLDNLAKFNKARKHLTLTHPQKPSKPTINFLEQMLAGPAVNGRSWQVIPGLVESSAKGAWSFGVKDNQDNTNRQTDEYGDLAEYTFVLNITKSTVANQNIARQVARKFCAIWERIPGPQRTYQAVSARPFLDMAFKLVVPGFKNKLTMPRAADRADGLKRNATITYVAALRYIDTTDSTRKSIKVEISPDKVNTRIPIPNLPTGFETRTTAWPIPSQVPASERQKHEHACKIVYYLLAMLQDKWGTRESIGNALALHKQSVMGEKHLKLGPYGGKILFRTRLVHNMFAIDASQAVMNSMKSDSKQKGFTRLPSITIRSQSKLRAQIVTKGLTEHWMATGDIWETWELACRRADDLNSQDISEIRLGEQCDCNNEQRATEFHACDNCPLIDICANMDWNADRTRYLCSECVGKQDTSRDPLSIQLESWIKNDGCYTALSAEQLKQEFGEAWDELNEYVVGDEGWASAATGQLLTRETMIRRVERHFMPSVDAVKPYHRMEDGVLRYHCPGNIAPVELAFNYMKHTWPARVGQIVQQFVNSEIDAKELVSKMDALHEVMLKQPYLKKARVGETMSSAQYKLAEQEIISCKPIATSKQPWGKWKARYQPQYPLGTPSAPSPNWRPKGFSRLKKLIKLIEQNFEDKGPLRTSEDGCPFPFSEEIEMPDDWSWWAAWSYFGFKTYRMWLFCNRYWDQVDCTETVFLECIWQFFSGSAGNILGIPSGILLRSPLCIVIAHLYHGSVIRSAWTRSDPVDLSDRDETLLNMSFEPQVINYLKSNFPNKVYDELVEMVKRIQIPKAWYDPDYVAKTTARQEVSEEASEEVVEQVTAEDTIDDET